MNIIDLQNINKSYGQHHALKNINLTIASESIFGLLGPNGAGKTSLLRILTQIIAPDSGSFFYKGEKPTFEHIQQLGYLPEKRGLYKKMTVEEQLLYFAQLKGMSRNNAKQKMNEWLEKFDMRRWAEKKVEELSKGMQQKVQFITTVIHGPELIILDEPFSGFDPLNSELITKAILDLRKSGSTIIFSTHRMETVETLCESMVLINKGEKILDGNVNTIKKNFKKNIYTIEGSGSLLTNDLFEILSLQNKEGQNFSATLQLKIDATHNVLLQEIMKHAEVHAFREEIPSIHDIFISAIKEVSHE